MKNIELHKVGDKYKILTHYKLDSGSYISSDPIFIVNMNEEEELISAIKSALESSKELSEDEEDDYWLGNLLLKKIKESSFNKLYSRSLSCMISLEGKCVKITKLNFLGNNKGLERDEEKSVITDYKLENLDIDFKLKLDVLLEV